MNVIWVNVFFLATLAIAGGLVAAIGAVLLDRWLKTRKELRQREELTEGYAPSDIIPMQRKSEENESDGA